MKLTKSNFDTEIENNKVSLVDFWAAWCGPCRMLTPTMNELINDYNNNSNVCVGKVDTEESPDLAAKYNISVLNTPGTIDSDYRGELKVILFNHGNNNFLINNKDRIAQMILIPVIKMSLEETDNLPETIRGEGGFGSTGK